jgi:hypothetical protein
MSLVDTFHYNSGPGLVHLVGSTSILRTSVSGRWIYLSVCPKHACFLVVIKEWLGGFCFKMLLPLFNDVYRNMLTDRTPNLHLERC